MRNNEGNLDKKLLSLKICRKLNSSHHCRSKILHCPVKAKCHNLQHWDPLYSKKFVYSSLHKHSYSLNQYKRNMKLNFELLVSKNNYFSYSQRKELLLNYQWEDLLKLHSNQLCAWLIDLLKFAILIQKLVWDELHHI